METLSTVDVCPVFIWIVTKTDVELILELTGELDSQQQMLLKLSTRETKQQGTENCNCAFCLCMFGGFNVFHFTITKHPLEALQFGKTASYFHVPELPLSKVLNHVRRVDSWI